MPKNVRSRPAAIASNTFSYVTGHYSENFQVISNIVTTAIGYSSGKVKSEIINEEFIPSLTLEETVILDNLGITSTLEVIVSNDDETTSIVPSNPIDSGTLTIDSYSASLNDPSSSLYVTCDDSAPTFLPDSNTM